jgi:hypothetical protein
MGPLQFARQFWIYSLWSLEALVFMPPLTILFFGSLIGLAAAFVKQRPFQHPLWKRSHWLVLTQLLFFPAVISIGILYPASGPSFQHPNSTASHVCDALGMLSLALAAFWVFRMKGVRWFALCLVIMLQLILLGALFVAGMAISGDWL